MKNGKKVLLALLVAGVSVGAFVFTTGASTPDGTMHYDLNANDAFQTVPVAFKHQTNLDADKNKVGYYPSQKNANLELHLDVKPSNSTSSKLLSVSGSANLRIGSENFNIQLDPSSRLYSATLADGQTFLWGPVNGVLMDKQGQESEVGMSVSYLPSSNQEYVTCTIGSFQGGLGALAFGTNFITPEMKNLQLKNH